MADLVQGTYPDPHGPLDVGVDQVVQEGDDEDAQHVIHTGHDVWEGEGVA